MSFSSLLRTGLSDPGIIPKGLKVEATVSTPRSATAATHPPYTQDVFVKGKKVSLKYCRTCNFYRPPRASHCSTCNNCVDGFDHHCPWVGNCVGKNNYRHFLVFVNFTVATCIVFFALSIVHLVLMKKAPPTMTTFEVLKQYPTIAIVLLVTAVVTLAGTQQTPPFILFFFVWDDSRRRWWWYRADGGTPPPSKYRRGWSTPSASSLAKSHSTVQCMLTFAIPMTRRQWADFHPFMQCTSLRLCIFIWPVFRIFFFFCLGQYEYFQNTNEGKGVWMFFASWI